MPETVERRTAESAIVEDQEICNGSPVVAGTRTRVLDIALAFEYNGMSPDEIVDHYPQLDLSDVHMALAYYYDNLDEMKAALRRKDEIGA